MQIVQMATSQIRRFVIGKVIARGSDAVPSVQVQVPKNVLDDYLLMFFNHPEQVWAADIGKTQCKVGDIVKIQELQERMTPLVTHEVCEHVFKIGEIIDPVTGKQCQGRQFVDEKYRDKIKSLLDKTPGSILKT